MLDPQSAFGERVPSIAVIAGEKTSRPSSSKVLSKAAAESIVIDEILPKIKRRRLDLPKLRYAGGPLLTGLP